MELGNNLKAKLIPKLQRYKLKNQINMMQVIKWYIIP